MLEGVGDAEKKRFIGDGADELQANRQAVRSKTAGNGNGRKTAEIGGAIVAEEQGARGMICAADGSRFLSDRRREPGTSQLADGSAWPRPRRFDFPHLRFPSAKEWKRRLSVLRVSEELGV